MLRLTMGCVIIRFTRGAMVSMCAVVTQRNRSRLMGYATQVVCQVLDGAPDGADALETAAILEHKSVSRRC